MTDNYANPGQHFVLTDKRAPGAEVVEGKTLLERATTFAKKAHTGQMYNQEPYFEHCKRVLARVQEVTCDEVVLVAAVLHDVMEDTPATLESIIKEFGSDVAAEVEALTRLPGEVYMNYITRAAARSRSRMVKRADLEENLAQAGSPGAPARAQSLKGRYQKALAFLDKEVSNDR